MARDENNTLVRTATGRWGQFRYRCFRDVDADDCEVAGLKLEDVRAVVEGDRLPAIRVRVGAKPAPEFDLRLHRPHHRRKRPRRQEQNTVYIR